MKKGKDEGFELIYWKLSYRRKFTRTLYTIPFVVGFVWIMYLCGQDLKKTIIDSIILIIIGTIQIVYNYKKWKQETIQ